jgi:hypothetical protein
MIARSVWIRHQIWAGSDHPRGRLGRSEAKKVTWSHITPSPQKGQQLYPPRIRGLEKNGQGFLLTFLGRGHDIYRPIVCM